MSIERGKLYNVEGLDATGKSTLAKKLQEAFRGVMTYCPPDWMKPYRPFFNNADVNMRFLYYAFSNFWVDRVIVRPFLERDGRYVFQDRTWLTTLTVHEYMGTSPSWLHLGLKLARKAVQPNIAFVIQVDNTERRRRMMGRDIINPDDLESLNNQTAMDNGYIKWTDRLRWNTVVFDNTHFTPDQARDALISHINRS